MARPAVALANALRGVAGAAPSAGRLYVVAVPRFDSGVTSVRAAVLVAGADVLRVPSELPPDVLAPLTTATRVAGSIAALQPGDVLPDRVTVQLVSTAVQTAPAVVTEIARLRAAGVAVEFVASTGEVDAALVAGGIGPGVAREPDDGRLDVAVLAADRPDVRAWRGALTRRGHLDHTPAVLVERAGTPQQRARTLRVRELSEIDAEGPVVLVVGDDVAGPEAWREDLPLAGVTVANLRAEHQAPALTALLRARGAEVVHAPMLAIEPGDLPAMAAAVGELAAGAYDLLAITSPNGAAALADALAAAGRDARALAGAATIACVGPGTAAALREHLAVVADLVAEVHTTDGLADAIGAPPHPGARALLARAERATGLLRDRLVAAGWQVVEVIAYRTTTRALTQSASDMLAAGDIDVVPVLSASMARALVNAGREHGVRAALVSIGPVTTGTLAELGVMPLVEAATSDLDGLVAAVEEAVATRGRRRR